MKKQWFIIITVSLFSACSSTLFIKNDESSYKELNKKLVGEDVAVRLLNGDEIDGVFNEANYDTATIGEIKLPTNDIKEIYIKSHGKGFLKGLGYGAVPGLVIGGSFLAIHGGEGYSGVLLLIGTPIGMLAGGIIGVINGDTERYIFPIDDSAMEPFIDVEFSKVIDKSRSSITILRKGKSIRLLKSEYKQRKILEDGTQIIVVPKEVYLEKF